MGADVTKKLEIIISSKANLTDAAKISKAFGQVKDRLTELSQKLGITGKRMGGFMRQAQIGREKVKALSGQMKTQATQVDKLEKKIQKLEIRLKKQSTTTSKVDKSTKRYRKTVDQLGTSYKKTEKAARHYDNTQGKIRGHTEGLRRVVGALRNQILLFLFALRGVIDVITSSVEASNQLESALVGLRAVTEKTGTSFHDANKFILEFTETGLISVASTAAGLKNLLSAGFGMPEAIQLMKTLGDAAAFNRQGTLEYGAAIEGATQGIKNQNSIMTDNAGITKNLNIMYKEFARTIGKGAMSLSEMEKRQAIYIGFLKEGAIFQGNMNLLTATYIGKTQKLSQSIFKAKAAFGGLIKEGLTPFVAEIEKAITAIAEWIKENEILIKSEVKVFLETITTSLRIMWDVLVAVNDALRIFGVNIKDVIVFFALFKGVSLVLGKVIGLFTAGGVALKILMGVAIGATAVITGFHRSLFRLLLVFRSTFAAIKIGTPVLIALRGAMMALGGPVTIIIGLITAAAAAWAYFSLKSKQASKIATETLEAQRVKTREMIRSNFDLAQSMVAKYQNQLKNKELTKDEIEVLKEKLRIEEQILDLTRREEAVERGRERLKPGERGASQVAIAMFKIVEKARFKEKKDVEGILGLMEKRLEKQKELTVGAKDEFENIDRIKRLRESELKTIIDQASFADQRRFKSAVELRGLEAKAKTDKKNQQALIEARSESLAITQTVVTVLRFMLGIEEKITDEIKQQKKIRESLLRSLRSLIEKLKGEIAALGLIGVAKQLTAFDAKIAILRISLEKFRKALKDIGEVEILEGLINQLDKLGRTAIIEDKIRDLTNELQKLGQTPLEQKINGINQRIGNMRFELAQTIMVLMRTNQVNEETIRWIEKWGEAIDELEKKLRDRLRADTLKKWADKSKASIDALNRSIFDLVSARTQGPIAGGLFGAGEKGEMDRLRIKMEAAEKLLQYEDDYKQRLKDIDTIYGESQENRAKKDAAIAVAAQDFERQVTSTLMEETEKRIALVQSEWEQRFAIMEQFVGGWQQLGGMLADIWIGQSNEMQAQIDRQRELMNRGKIDQQQFEDRKAQIEKAAQKDREKAAARFGANMLRQAGQIAQAYLFQAAAAQFATAGATASNASMWSAHFLQMAASLEVAAAAAAAIPFGGFALAAGYHAAAGGMVAAAGISTAAAAGSVAAGVGLGVAGIAVGIGTGLAASAIEANNLGSEGGFLGTPTEDVFEDRNKRLGGSIRAQEVHLSINPVTYIQAEGDIFIGEGITVETFKGFVNEAFINRAQDALEEGTLQIDALVNVKG